jgi:hypothetical protein
VTFRAGLCLAGRLSRRWAGFHGPWCSLPGRSGVLAGYPDGSACRRVMAAVISQAQGQRSASRSRRRRPPRVSRPAAENRPSRRRFGSQRRAFPVRASSCVQARSSLARATISHQSWFWAKPFSGRFRSPVSLAQRMRSSHPPAARQAALRPAGRAHQDGGARRPVDRGCLHPGRGRHMGGPSVRAAGGIIRVTVVGPAGPVRKRDCAAYIALALAVAFLAWTWIAVP